MYTELKRFLQSSGSYLFRISRFPQKAKHHRASTNGGFPIAEDSNILPIGFLGSKRPPVRLSAFYTSAFQVFDIHGLSGLRRGIVLVLIDWSRQFLSGYVLCNMM